MDLVKVFDRVDRQILIDKFEHKFNVPSREVSIIRYFYIDVESTFKVQGKYSSESFTTNVGVRQGHILSLLLFAVYVNDFIDQLNDESSPRLYMLDYWNTQKVGDKLKVSKTKINSIFYADDLVCLLKIAIVLTDCL